MFQKDAPTGRLCIRKMKTLEKYKNKHRIKSSRLQGYDYSQNGMYFVTICTKEREHFFGKVKNGKMVLNNIGKVAYQFWQEISQHFPFVRLDTCQIMPNHIHLIVEINVGVQFIEPANKIKNKSGFDKSNPYKKRIKNNPMLLNKITLGKIIRYFKAKSSNEIKKQIEFWKFSWQRNYYDHIIRNEIELNKIREYIILNPQQWERDINNIENLWM